MQSILRCFSKKQQNNTTHTLFLPSEFASNWENIGKKLVIDAFDSFLEQPFRLFHLISDCILCCYDYGEALIEDRLKKCALGMNVTEVNEGKFMAVLRDILKEYFDSAFNLEDSDIEHVKQSVLKKTEEYEYFDREELEDDMRECYFDRFLRELVKSCLFMQIHEPKLNFYVKPYSDRKIQYSYMNNEEFYFIEGQFKDNSPSLLLLPPPQIKENLPFMGMKWGVYILQDPSENAISECNKRNLPVKSNLTERSNPDKTETENKKIKLRNLNYPLNKPSKLLEALRSKHEKSKKYTKSKTILTENKVKRDKNRNLPLSLLKSRATVESILGDKPLKSELSKFIVNPVDQ